MNTVDVVAAYAIPDQDQLIVHLASFDWEFERYGLVKLVIGNDEFDMRYVGSGNLEGKATLILETCEHSPTVNEIEYALKDHTGAIRVVRSD